MEKTNESSEREDGQKEPIEDKLSLADRERFLELREAFKTIINNSSISEILNDPETNQLTKELKELVKKAESRGEE